MRKSGSKFCSDEDVYQTAMRAIHDFRAPMRALAASHEMLRDVSGDDEAFEPALHFSDIAHRRITALLDGLAAYVEATMQEYDFAEIALVDVVDEAWARAKLAAPDHDAVLEISGLPKVFADKDGIVQLLRHMFENAILYSQANRRVTVQLHVTDTPQGTELRIEDDGPGIETRYAHRIFDPMFRLVAKSDVEGAGVGLSICEKIMQGHHGHISFIPSDDCGAKFYIFFPNLKNL